MGRFATIENSLTNARAFQLFQLMRQGGLIVIAVALAKAPLSVAEVGNYEMLTYLGYRQWSFGQSYRNNNKPALAHQLK